MKRIFYYILLLAFLSSCTYEFPFEEEITYQDTVSINKIVVIGGSFTAGIIDGAIPAGTTTHNSFTQILSDHLIAQGISQNGIINAQFGGSQPYHIYANDTADQIIGGSYLKFPSVEETRQFDKNPLLPVMNFNPGEMYVKEDRSLDEVTNYSFPHFNTEVLIADDLGATEFNKYFNSGSRTLPELVSDQDPDLIIMELAIDELINAVLSNNWRNEPLDQALEERLGIFLQRLEGVNAPILLFNVPDITLFPFFNEIPYNIFLNGSEASLLYNSYREFNDDLLYWNYIREGASPNEYRPPIDFDVDYQPGNGYVLVDSALSNAVDEDGNEIPKIRQASLGENIFFSLYDRLKPVGLGTLVPIPDEYSLTTSEIAELQNAVNAYNLIIDRIVNVNENVYLFDLNAWYDKVIRTEEVNEGLLDSGEVLFNSVLPSGAFSSDGIHLNERANAILVNEFIKTLNSIHSISIPEVNTGIYQGNAYENNN